MMMMMMMMVRVGIALLVCDNGQCFALSDKCPCCQPQMMNRIVESCQLTRPADDVVIRLRDMVKAVAT